MAEHDIDKEPYWLQYAKMVIALVGAAVTSVIVTLPTVGVDVPPWLAIVSSVLTVLGVYRVPNAVTDAQRNQALKDAIEATPGELPIR